MNSEAKGLAQLKSLRAERDKLKQELSEVKGSFSYRLGNMLVEALAKPGRNTILLPYRLARLGMAGLKKRRSH